MPKPKTAWEAAVAPAEAARRDRFSVGHAMADHYFVPAYALQLLGVPLTEQRIPTEGTECQESWWLGHFAADAMKCTGVEDKDA